MSRRPDYKLKVWDKDTGARTEVGAAWRNADGTLSVTVYPCVILTDVNTQSPRQLKLWPVDREVGGSDSEIPY